MSAPFSWLSHGCARHRDRGDEGAVGIKTRWWRPACVGRLLARPRLVTVLIDGAFTARFDEVGALLLALAWLAVLVGPAQQ